VVGNVVAASQTCGNNVSEGSEPCDGTDLNNRTCQTHGFLYGAVRCGDGCALDTSGCTNTRFVDNTDGTITDHKTGLMWEKKVKLDSTADAANPHDADNAYPWSCGVEGCCEPAAASSATCITGVGAQATIAGTR
jgi:hypothetical protein